jgi:membrane-bound lytic murein transglycosylase A
VRFDSNRAGLLVALTLLLAGVLLHVFRPTPVPDGLVLKPVLFSELTGWTSDNQGQALAAFQKSCVRFATLPGTRSLGAAGIAGTIADWQQPCLVARTLPPGDDAAARLFFETRFTPFQAHNRDQTKGLFTGYYEPSLRGSLVKSPVYHTPLHTRPADLVTVELGNFRNDLTGRRIAGRLKGNRLVPFPDRKQIVAGKLAQKDTTLVWVDDAIDAFFLQIQGSGRVALEGGDEMRVGYAATNGQPYTAIGRDLIRRGALTRENVSLQSIRTWLQENPAEAGDVMALNKSYVFFRKLSEDGPVGAQSVVLTPERSLAVDRKFIPLGVPVWLNATAPAAEPAAEDWKLQRLMVAQDTGGAIRGPVRGDVFWGYGPRAEQIAGRMKNTGGYYLLLPKVVARRIEAAGEK